MEVRDRIFLIISQALDDPTVQVADDTPLLGEGGLLDSIRLVEVCVNLEDLAVELGAEFDWTSDSAMSRSRSIFRTAGALANEFENQLKTRS